MKVGLFFTFGISVKIWKERGLLDREKLLYERMLKGDTVKQVLWFTYGSEDNQIKNGLHDGIEIIPMTRLFNSMIGKLIYSFLMPIIHRKNIKDLDILKTNQMSGSWTAVISSKLYKKPLIVRTGYTWSLFASRNNTSILDRFASLVEKIAYRNADIAVVATYKDADYVSNKYRINTNRLRVVPNYVDTDLFSFTDSDRYENRIIFVGRLTEQKNLKNLIRALQGLLYELDIYGSGELKEDLTKLAKSLNVKVNFMGNVPNSEMPEVLNRYHVFVFPSLYEGMPKALLEAMACGCTVIGTDVDGIREIIKDNINGVLCDTTAESIKGAIEKIMDDKELIERLGKQARAFVVENYSLKSIVLNEQNVYREICRI